MKHTYTFKEDSEDTGFVYEHTWTTKKWIPADIVKEILHVNGHKVIELDGYPIDEETA
jgi:hypothetical protein